MSEETTTIRRPQKRPAFVVASMVAARLTSVAATAKDITLSAKNAKAVVVRGGEGARVFLPITDYIEQLASESIRSAQGIELNAVSLSRLAVRETRMRQVCRQLDAAIASASGDRKDQIEKLRVDAGKSLVATREEYANQTDHLERLLEQAYTLVRPARFISVNSRVEAARDPQAYQALQVVADQLETAADHIQKEVTKCSALLEEIIIDSGEEA